MSGFQFDINIISSVYLCKILMSICIYSRLQAIRLLSSMIFKNCLQSKVGDMQNHGSEDSTLPLPWISFLGSYKELEHGSLPICICWLPVSHMAGLPCKCFSSYSFWFYTCLHVSWAFFFSKDIDWSENGRVTCAMLLFFWAIHFCHGDPIWPSLWNRTHWQHVNK